MKEYGQFTSKRAWIDSQVESWKAVRRPYESVWLDLIRFQIPFRSRFLLSEQNQGIRLNDDLIDSTITYCHKTFKGGMLATNASPSGQWFTLRTPDRDLSEYGPHAQWLELVRDRILRRMAATPYYSVLGDLIGDAGGLGNGAMCLEEDLETTFHARSVPLGSYWIGKDRRGSVSHYYSQRRITLYQAIEECAPMLPGGEPDLSSFSESAQRAYRDNKLTETWIDVGQFIYPNPKWRPANPMSKRFLSCHVEMGTAEGGWTGADRDKILKESGFNIFPIKCYQWGCRDGDVWGLDCPGMDAFGDVKQVHLGERRELQAIEKGINPPLVGPPEIASMRLKLGPGEANGIDEGTSKGLRSIYDVQFRIAEHAAKQEQVRGRIKNAYHVPLFRLFEGLDDSRERTATEVAARQSEKMVLLSPNSQNLQQGALGPSVESIFEFMVRQDDVPPAPRDLRGAPLEIEYEGPMAQAQKAAGLAAISQVVGMVGQIAEVDPEVLSDMNWSETVREYGRRAQAPANIFRSPEEAAAMRQARAEAEAAMRKVDVIGQGAKAAKDLAAAKTGEESLLTQLTGGGA